MTVKAFESTIQREGSAMTESGLANLFPPISMTSHLEKLSQFRIGRMIVILCILVDGFRWIGAF
jgi:hypothetical protein